MDGWRKLIKEVREVYTGLVTAAANPSEEYSKAYWDDLDFIGVVNKLYFLISIYKKGYLLLSC